MDIKKRRALASIEVAVGFKLTDEEVALLEKSQLPEVLSGVAPMIASQLAVFGIEVKDEHDYRFRYYAINPLTNEEFTNITDQDEIARLRALLLGKKDEKQ